MRAEPFGAVLVIALAAHAVAQVPPPSIALTDPHAITFHDIRCAESAHDYSLTQMRFASFVDPVSGFERWSGFLEWLDVGPASGADSEPRFDLRLGTGLGFAPNEEARQASLHADHEAFLQRYATFRVHDPELASANYTIHFEGADYRLGRPVFVVSVLPNDPARNVWLLDLDIETGYPLSRSEYTPTGQLLGMLAVVSFTHGSSARSIRAAAPPVTWWTPNHSVRHPSPESAAKSMGRPATIVAPLPTPPGFVLHETAVATDPLTGDETLVMTLSDGIEAAFYLQTPGAPAPSVFSLVNEEDSRTVAILDFTDLATKQLMFHARGALHIVVGDARDPHIDRFAESMLRAILD